MKLERPLDRKIIMVVFCLLGLGLILVYSATYIYAIEKFSSGLFFFRKQLLFAVLGMVAMLLVAKIPQRWLEVSSYPIWFLAVGALGLTLVPGIGVKVGGASRWLELPFGFRFEPAESLKLALCLLLATFFSKKSENSIGKGLLFLALVGGPLALVLRQPDFGTFVICVLVLFSLLFYAGLAWKYIIGGALTLLAVLSGLVLSAPYRRARVLAFLDPWSDPAEKGFQMIQSLLSFYAGGISGSGLGQGQSKLYFLPEAHTDFILSVLGEEVGFLGVVMVLALFGFLIFRGFQISLRCTSTFGKYLALTVTMTLAFSVFVNAGVALGLLPTKGLALPFLSYGGSSLLASCIGVGLLLNIDSRFGRVHVGK